MQTKSLVITVVLTSLITLIGVGVVVASFAPTAAIAHSFGGSHHMGGGHGHRGPACSRLNEHHLDLAEAFVTAHLDLDDDQQAALEPMMNVLEGWRADVRVTCESADLQTVGDGLATAEAMLSRTARAAADLQSAYQTFEASLNADQRAHIDEMMARHRARHGDQG